ncbi:CDC45-like protein [Choiromyces venosus 120613-1]|uniref:CDC45-like protein n=1 Tax=Choiromyces venosus 120613-1 TaxID=1336337 RepID=A0A3N4JZD6_9PEZI|nr:CDC45-like protein [Choiromyces venosus 120613-1]
MYIPRPLLSSAYAHLKAHAHSTNPSILLLCALDTDSLCAARILTHLLKQDYIPHKIHPVAGYQELENVNKTLIKGNEELRFVICLGLGGLIDIAAFLDLTGGEGERRRVECWLVDGRRPWNLCNVFGAGGGGEEGSSRESSPLIHRHTLLSHPSSRALASSPPPAHSHSPTSSPSQRLPLPPPEHPPPTAKFLRRKLRRLRAKHESTITNYYTQGTWYGEPISGLLYSLASDLGREDNDLLWLAIVGLSSGEIIGRGITSGPPRKAGGLGWVSTTREDQIRGVLRDEVRRLNPPDAPTPGSSTSLHAASYVSSSLQTTARSPSDTAIRLSPEYRFMLIRHWSLYDSMLHSSFLGTKLHIWSETGRKRLHKLLAKMGFSLSQCKQSYTHMDMDLKRSLRERLEKYAPLYGLEGVVREGFVRCWGFRGCLSAADVAYVIGGLLEMGRKGSNSANNISANTPISSSAAGKAPEAPVDPDPSDETRKEEARESESWIANFWAAYDALEDIEALKSALPTAMDLTRAILRTGTALIEKRQILLLRAFRLAVVKEGPDVATFAHPNALSKLALWLGEAILEQEKEQRKTRHLPLVVASLNERRGVYVVVGTALGSRIDEDEDDASMERRSGRNKFGMAFQEVANSTNARIRIDAFEATVVEVRKEDLAGFLEGLSLKSVVG